MSVYRGELINIEQKRREKKKLVKKVTTLFVFSFTGSGPSFVSHIIVFYSRLHGTMDNGILQSDREHKFTFFMARTF
jgi:hypothetical protein